MPHTREAVTVNTVCTYDSSSAKVYQTGNGALAKRGYRNNENCLYQFMAPAGLRILMDFPHFDLERNFDHLDVLYNAIPGYPQSLTDRRQPFYFISKTNSISLRFTSDNSITKTGFVLQFSVTLRAAKAVTDDATITTRTPVTTTTPWSRNTFLYQNCNNYRGLTTGDSLYGAIKSPNYPSSYPSYLYCSWTTRYAYYSRKYVLHFESFDTAYSDYVYVRDGPSSSASLLKRIAGRNQHSKPVVTTTSQFYIRFRSSSYRSYSGFLMHYSTYPGCFQCTSGFIYRIAYTRNPVYCMQRCKAYGYRYVYIKARSSCYCGGFEGSFTFTRCTLKHPGQCSSCYWPYNSYKCGSYSYGSIYEIAVELTAITTPRPTPMPWWKWTTPYNRYQGHTDTTVGHSTTVPAVVGTLVGLAFIAILSALCYAKYRKRRPPTRLTTGPNPGDANGSHGHQMPVAYYVPAATQNGAPPSYSDALNGRVYFFNNVYGAQTVMAPVSMTHEAPPSFVDAMSGQAGEKPPTYEAISDEISRATTIVVQGAQAAEPVRNVSPIPPKPDNGWQVSMPGVEEPTQVERPPSRNRDYQSMTSLRGATNTGSAARLNAPPQRNTARNLPPIQRVRGANNRAFDEDM